MKPQVAEQGFAILPHIFLPREMDPLIESFNRYPLTRSKAGFRHALRDSSIAEFARDFRLVGIATDILGSEALPYRATLFDKSVNSNWLVAWHQDTALPLRERHDTPGWNSWSIKDGTIYAHAPADVLCSIVALRVHLDDSTADNGPLRVLPGSHTLGVLNDREIADCTRRIAPTECLVPSGGVLAMRPLLVHASSKCRLTPPRRVLHIEYTASLKIAPGLELAIA